MGHLAACDQGLDGVNGDNDSAAPVVTRHGRQARVRKLSSPDQIANVIGTAADNGGCLFDAERQALGIVRTNGEDEVLARAANLLIGRAAFETAKGMYPRDLIEYRKGAQDRGGGSEASTPME